jgi:malonyl CoA-acyl carrier protein transacylase/thioesterase domain-containing protein
LLPLSANCKASLAALTGKYIQHINDHPEQTIAQICFSAATTRDHFKHRLAVVACSREELLARLREFCSGEDTSQVACGQCQSGGAGPAERVGFLFTGQGTQYAGMGRELYESQPVFRDTIDRCGSILSDQLDLPLTKLLSDQSTATAAQLDQTMYLQPALFALQYALVELWKSWGISPTAVIGHSSGEYAAACAAGVMTLEVGLQLVATRGQLMDSLPQTGTMAVVMADEARVQAAIKPYGEQISIAAVNGPDIVVISGQREATEQVVRQLQADGVDTETLNTSNAGHSALIDPMLEPLRSVADNLPYAPPRIAMISNVTGELAGNEVACGSYWVRHAREPVRFADGIKALAATGCNTFVEIGPAPNLLAMGMGCLKRLRPRPTWLPSLTKDRSSWDSLLHSLAKLYVKGNNIDWAGFHRPYDPARVSLPTYMFARQTFPVQHDASQEIGQGQGPTDPAALVAGSASTNVNENSPSASAAVKSAVSDLTTHAQLDPAGYQTVDRQQKTSPLPAPSLVAATLDHFRFGLEAESRAVTSQLDEAAIRYVINAFEQLGFAWNVDAAFSEQQLHRQVPEPSRPKLARVLSRLTERGLLDQDNGVYRVKLAAPDGDAEAILQALQRDADYPECELMRRAGSSLASIWKGEVEPLSILFPDGATDQAGDFYSHSRLLEKYNAIAGQALGEAVSRLPTNASLRVLEVGAGTGGLTTFLLPQLPAAQSEYVFTDLSPLFLHAAQQRFSEYPFLQTQLLDISQPGQRQGLPAGSFDLVVAANVLHATPRLHETLSHVNQLLKPGGWLMLLEAANPPFWGDMVFTLIDGWWNFKDTQLRPDYPLMQRDRWVQVLSETQFDDIACLNDAKFQDESQNTLYLARAKTTVVSPAAPSEQPAAASGHGIITPTVTTTATSKRQDDDTRTLRDSLVDIFDQNGMCDLVRNHAARVMRLKPDDIELTQPLSELGLDSLMATELRAQLGHTFGRELSLNTLQMRRSIQEIAAYVHEDQASADAHDQATADSSLPDLEVNTPRAHLVPLQPNGNKTPLFFIPAGYGDLFAFQQISHAIGMNQPVYGLQPASAKRVKTFRQMSIYRLVSAYISEITKVQPEGPYFLSGYSAGAIIVVELARELMRQGKDVGLLVIFDPPSHVPRWLDSIYEINYRISVATGLINVASRLRSRFARRLFHTVLDEGLRTHTSVTRNHRVAPYPGRITHFRASLSQSSLVGMKPAGRFWRQIAQEGTEVHWIPGTHYGMLRGSGASVVVDELRDCLQRATSSHRPNRSERQGTLP